MKLVVALRAPHAFNGSPLAGAVYDFTEADMARMELLEGLHAQYRLSEVRIYCCPERTFTWHEQEDGESAPQLEVPEACFASCLWFGGAADDQLVESESIAVPQLRRLFDSNVEVIVLGCESASEVEDLLRAAKLDAQADDMAARVVAHHGNDEVSLRQAPDAERG